MNSLIAFSLITLTIVAVTFLRHRDERGEWRVIQMGGYGRGSDYDVEVRSGLSRSAARRAADLLRAATRVPHRVEEERS